VTVPPQRHRGLIGGQPAVDLAGGLKIREQSPAP
jgi:hypothetical protein